MSRATLARPRRARVRAGAAGRDLAELLERAPAIGEDELAWWPRATPCRADAMPALPVAEVAAWIVDHAREEFDELAFLRVAQAGVVDVALGVVSGRAGWAPAGSGWMCVGPTRDLMAGGEGLVARLEAALRRNVAA